MRADTRPAPTPYIFALYALLPAVLTALLFSGALKKPEAYVSDRLYYRPAPLEPYIYLINIDETAQSNLGLYTTWTRSYIAEVIERLNAVPERRPTVIGVDVMYFGHTAAEHDGRLAAAAAAYDNVVVAALAEFSPAIVEIDGKAQLDNNAVTRLEMPYAELREAATVGHANFQPDTDGVIRHVYQAIDLPAAIAAETGITSLPSLSLAVYQKYAAANGLPADPRSPARGRYHSWRIPYAARPGDYSDSFSVWDILNEDLPATMFSGSIVLIGPYAAGMMDAYITPISPVPMYGVEIHANAVDAMVRGVYYVNAPNSVMYVVTYVALLLLFIVYARLHPALSAALTLAVAGGYILLAVQLVFPANPDWFLFDNVRYLLPTVQLPVGAALLYVGNLVFHVVASRREKRKVTDAFKKYVDPAIINDIMETGLDNLALGGRLCDICVMFIDIRGFTPMSEKMAPPEVVNMLNDYLEITSTAIFRHGGTLDKFIGDATMAFWGAPIPQEDMVYKAALAALDIVSRGREMEATLRERYDTTVSFGVGIHCGEAVVGNIGTTERVDYTAIGNTVNTAARLESNAKAGQILISEAVCQALAGRVTAELIGNIPLKGKSEEIAVYALTGLM